MLDIHVRDFIYYNMYELNKKVLKRLRKFYLYKKNKTLNKCIHFIVLVEK